MKNEISGTEAFGIALLGVRSAFEGRVTVFVPLHFTIYVIIRGFLILDISSAIKEVE